MRLDDKLRITNHIQKTFLKPCKYGSKWQHLHKHGTAIGLGLVSQHPETRASQLMEVVLQRDETCGSYDLRQESALTPQTQICYSIPGTAATCTGDMGGPIVHEEGGHVKCVIGISSYNVERCDDPDYPSIFMGAGILRTWIRRHVNGLK